MSVSRRTTLRALGAAGATLAMSGSVLAVGEHEDDERDPEEDEEEDEVEPVDAAGAAVRVAHFSPDAPNVDVFVDGDQILEDVAFDEVSEYLEIEPGTYTVEVTAAGDPDTVAFEGEVEIGQAFYTIAAIGELEADTFEPLVLVDAGAALARLAHASPDAPAVDIFPAGGDEPLFANVGFGDTTDYVPLPVGTYELEVRPAAEDDVEEPVDEENDVEENDEMDENDVDEENDVEEPVDEENDVEEPDEMDEAVFTVDVDLAPGLAYTGYAIGYLQPEDDQPPFDVNVTIDGPFADEEPVEIDPDLEEPVEEVDEEPVDEEPVDDEEEPVDDEEPADEEELDDEEPMDEEEVDEEPADDEENDY